MLTSSVVIELLIRDGICGDDDGDLGRDDGDLGANARERGEKGISDRKVNKFCSRQIIKCNSSMVCKTEKTESFSKTLPDLDGSSIHCC